MRLASLLLAGVCLPVVFAQSGSEEPENHDFIVKRLVIYHDSGEYDREIRVVTDEARQYLEQRVRPGERLAAVFDIDETALSNWATISDCGFCSYPTQLRIYPRPPIDPAIAPVLKLYNDAKRLGVTVFFITGRPDDQRRITEVNLIAEGYCDWKCLFMQVTGHVEHVSEFKEHARQQIAHMGYHIVLNIGDQASDLVGCCAERSFKLPNPFYFIP
jgi:predicted secreted acid phosphatase